MFNEEDLALLARTTRSEVAQRALYQNKQLETLRNLALNCHLAAPLWRQMYENATGFELTTRLLTNAPTPELADSILTQKDPSILTAALTIGIKNLKQSSLVTIAASHLGTSPFISKAITLSGAKLPEELALRLWKESYQLLRTLTPETGYGQLSDFDKILSVSPLPTDEEILDFADPGSIWYYLLRAVDRRPSLIRAMHTRPNPERYYQITPISRHLSTEDAGEILEYCAANPPATNATLNEQAAIPQILAHLATNLWLIPSLRLFALRLYRELVAKSKGQLSRATLLNGTVNWSALEYELDELLQADPHSPALSQLTASPTQTQLDQITTAIQLRGDWGYYPALLDQLANLLPEQQAHTAPLLSEQQSAYLDSLGTTGWDIFISLLPGWQQDIQALIAVTTASAHR